MFEKVVLSRIFNKLPLELRLRNIPINLKAPERITCLHTFYNSNGFFIN